MRFFHPAPITGEKIETTAITRRVDRTNGREYYAVTVPPAFRQPVGAFGAYIECQPGSIILALHEVGRGFNVIPPEERAGVIDVPDHIPVETVKGIAPHLMSEDEVREYRQRKAGEQSQQSAPQQPQKQGGDPKSQRT